MVQMGWFWGVLMFLSVVISTIEGDQQAQLVNFLPGFNGNFPSKHYSGYMNLGNKNLFYYFVVSERNPSKDPVVLWLNGGPGCSSFDGFVYEHGPFNFQAGPSKGNLPILKLNPYSWSKVSNIIYLDSPVGVGLSYSKNQSDYETGDLKTASDSHFFLLKWFELYPEFLKNPFYVAGESYGGIYVPTLASQIAKGIKTGAEPKINLKGYMVGNGVTDPKFDGGNALVPFAHGMGLISEDIYQETEAACKGDYYEPTNACIQTLQKVEKALDGLNIYNILEPCYHDPESESKKKNSSLPRSFQELGKSKKIPVRKRIFGRAWPLWTPVKDGIVPSWPQLAEQGSVGCINDEIATTWLNDVSVRAAIHAHPESISGRWELCTHRLLFRHDAGSMIPYHKTLTTQGYRALIFSGDHDMCVPYTGSQAWIRSLGYKIIDEWRSWIFDYQIAGYLQEYEKNLTFLTIKGAGHTVPEYKPEESLNFYTRWLDGLPI
ncbi:serine carboxypeptidase-like 20 isoform X1 [Euphorbia lathyris]|uniref:serine carboxypeptidase-like 20 isoform X1 n=2 Tax=Euphorbia lathyris TaxID=212925 RepID=UPI0033137709